MKRTKRSVVMAAVLPLTLIGIGSLVAQERLREPKPDQTETDVQAKDLAIVGKIVDLQSYMTGKVVGKDPMKWSRECIRRGVPAALETETGLIILGVATGRPTKIAEHVTKTVHVEGKLHEKGGIKYLEVTNMKPAKPDDETYGLEEESNEDLEDEADEDVEEELDDEPQEEPEPDPDTDDSEDDY
jgi:hypothetical protein